MKNFVGGKAGANVAEATVRLKFSPTLYEWLKAKKNERISVMCENDEIVISAVGIGSQDHRLNRWSDTAEPHIVPKDHPMLRALMDTYMKYTGVTGKKYT